IRGRHVFDESIGVRGHHVFDELIVKSKIAGNVLATKLNLCSRVSSVAIVKNIRTSHLYVDTCDAVARHGDTLAWACRMCIGIGGDHGPQTEPPILSVEPHKNLSTRSSCKDSHKSSTMCGLRYLKQLVRIKWDWVAGLFKAHVR
nr:hypothetical protein [Tanacetum cinerariifolium]